MVDKVAPRRLRPTVGAGFAWGGEGVCPLSQKAAPKAAPKAGANAKAKAKAKGDGKGKGGGK